MCHPVTPAVTPVDTRHEISASAFASRLARSRKPTGWRRYSMRVTPSEIDHDLGKLRAGGSQLDVTAVQQAAVADDVFEVEPPGRTGEASGAAAGHDRMLAAPLDLVAGSAVGIPLRFELVGGGEQPGRAAIEAADENLPALLEVDAAW